MFEDASLIERERKDARAVGEMTPIRNAASEISGFVKILRDRTRARAAEEAAADERRALEILNRAGSALAAETDAHKLVQIVTDAGVELSGAEFGAFFYEHGESYKCYLPCPGRP